MVKSLYRAFLLGAVLVLMALMFAFSAQEGPESNALTETTVMPVAEFFTDITRGSEDALVAAYNLMGTVVRKVAHILEYALLGLLLHLLLMSWGISWRWLPFVIGVCYAATDEIHQAFVPGRLGTPVDVLIDAIGVAAGVLIVTCIKRSWRRTNVHHP